VSSSAFVFRFLIKQLPTGSVWHPSEIKIILALI
jgi:hypothetical protein